MTLYIISQHKTYEDDDVEKDCIDNKCNNLKIFTLWWIRTKTLNNCMWRGWIYALSGAKITVKNKFFCFSDRSYRNRKSHEISGCLEAILRVLGMIYGMILNTPPPKIGLKTTWCTSSVFTPYKNILIILKGGNQGIKVGTLGGQNERNSSYVMLC